MKYFSKLPNYLFIILLFYLILISFALSDNSIVLCMDSATSANCSDCVKNVPSTSVAKVQATIMDGMNCHYQVDLFTKQPIINKDGSLAPPVCKTNFGFMMDAIRDMTLSAQQQKDSSSTS